MLRLRITLLLLALGIAIPAALIVQRAIASLDLENRYRHEAVARRVFDEMERALSDFLVREEGRNPADYDGDEAAPFRAADEPFVVGWFALDESGAPRVVQARGDRAQVVQAVAAALAQPEREADAARTLPEPGRTRTLGAKGIPETSELDAIAEQAEDTAYEVLSSLNRAQALRSERQSKARKSAPGSAPISPSFGFEGSGVQPAPAPSSEAARVYDLGDTAGPAEGLAVLAEREEAEEAIAEAPGIDPLIGRATPDGSLVLVRSVWQAGRGERQGVVLDRTGLERWLEERVLATPGLRERIQIEFGSPGSPSERAAAHRYLHRFGEPFDALVARLDLEALPGLGGPQPIYALSILLLAVAGVGLFAVQRGAKVVVDYAQRRSDFVASVSHELKTPLTAIRMYGEMLRDGLVRDDDKRAEYYATIADESERLSRLIDNVLDFSRLEQDQRKLELVVGSLEGAVRETAEKLRAHVEREGFALRIEVEGHPSPVRYDRDAVTQIVFNLVDNALKYARTASERQIVIGLRQDGDRVELRVRDFGPGVPATHLRRVFEPFYRGGDELVRSAKGTGIGLALVRELSEAMGAIARADRPPGGGFQVAVAFAAREPSA